MKKILIVIMMIFLLSCNDKREGLVKLNNVMNNIDLALKTSDQVLIESVIKEIEVVEELYPEQQSLKEKKYQLQLKLKKYEDAIKTIDTLIILSPDDVDNRVVQGIIYEIIGYQSKSDDVLQTALEKIDIKIKNMLPGDDSKRLGRELNRLMILKLLRMDQIYDYELVKNDPKISKFPSMLQLVNIMENGSREAFINKYR